MAAPSQADRRQIAPGELLRRADAIEEPFSPEIVLFVDDTQASVEARSLLEAAGERYHVCPASGENLPAATCGGVVFERLVGIQDMVAGLAALDAQADLELRTLLPRLGGATGATHAGADAVRKAGGADTERANSSAESRA